MPTLNTASLSNLAAALGPDGLKLAMCLNVPTTALITIQLQGLETGWVLDSIISNMLFYWKLMRRTAKDRDKVDYDEQLFLNFITYYVLCGFVVQRGPDW